jgi:O-methyltransferase involved in polyketide biosynthesis
VRRVKANDANLAVFADHHAGIASSQGPIAVGIETDASEHNYGIAPGLGGVPETMLWALHNRVCEAKRHDTVLSDPDSIRIYEAIDYDFARHFGNPDGSLAVRAAEIDLALRKWLERYPDGFVVSLGEGLETQVRRVDNGRVRWLSVDLPDAIRLREHFIIPTGRFRHIAISALDPAWMDAVDPSLGVFIIAQGLFMYLQPEQVRQLVSGIADRFPGAEMVFDVVPRWFSQLTLWGLNQTPHYRLPRMPWGINRDEVEETLRHWHPSLSGVEFLNYRALRGLPFLIAQMMQDIPVLRHEVPSLVHVTVATTVSRSPEISKLRANRKQQMTSNIDQTNVDKIGGMYAKATRSVGRGNDLAIAAGHIAMQRVALGMKGALNPRLADHDEFARMVPEKVEAFSAAGIVMFTQSNQANQQVIRFASEEVMATTRAVIGIVGCSSPAAFMQAQGNFVCAWFDRAASNFIAMGMIVLDVQDAVMAPIRQTVAVNAERLGQYQGRATGDA